MDLRTFLADADDIPRTRRFKLLLEREQYYEGKQYEHRPLDANGYRKGSPGVYGSAVRTPPWEERDPGCVWNLVAEGVHELTAWTLGGENFCHLDVVGDAEGTDWLNAVAEVAGLRDVLVQARNWGGSLGTAVVSVAVRQGEVEVEAHNPRHCWPLAWRDERHHVPAEVVMLYTGDNPMAQSEADLPLCARHWTEAEEALYQREKDGRGEWVWRQLEVVAHGLGVCPVVWHPQRAPCGQHDGLPDGGRCHGEVDEVNELYAAASATTKRNADDTLVVKTSPMNNPGQVRKGGFNTIFSEHGAEYLSQKGESAEICIKLADRHAEHIWRRFGVVMPNLDTLGKATTAEMLKRLMARTINTSGELRRDYAKGLIVPLARMLLTIGRRVAARRQKLRIPPRETVDTKLGATVQTERTPGKGDFVQCLWPPPFLPSVADIQAMITAARAATGDRQVMSQRTAVEYLKMSPLPIKSVEQELEAIADDEKKAAEKAEKIAEGKAPPEGDKAERDEEEEPASEKTPASDKGQAA